MLASRSASSVRPRMLASCLAKHALGESARVLLTTIDDTALMGRCLSSQATRPGHTYSTLISPTRNRRRRADLREPNGEPPEADFTRRPPTCLGLRGADSILSARGHWRAVCQDLGFRAEYAYWHGVS